MPKLYSAAAEVLAEYKHRRISEMREGTHFICIECGDETLAQFEARSGICLSCQHVGKTDE
ncbi:hypothetical protein [Bradyrhizobium sp. 18]|uniref:hypothetical protein n=1 Tax=Bradyrhizobium sp. 18 TaxID=2782657 RepID=UPI001FF78C6D|nr:hypothetical protein [Bradyrhizobium sp. 18]MCK1503900.1 hypothetical protein [Bradyrhizobium sp. 18]